VGKGGRRFGAGRRGWKRECEDFLPLNIRQLKEASVACTANGGLGP
jgi:hypothetical protein